MMPEQNKKKDVMIVKALVYIVHAAPLAYNTI